MLAFHRGWPGHLGEGGHIRSWPGIGYLRVAQTLVGRTANRPKGFPVRGGEPPTDAEIAVLPMTVSVRNARCSLNTA